MDVSSLAAADQSASGDSVDSWIDMKLEPMTKIWQGVGGTSSDFLSEEDARVCRGSYDGTKPVRFAESLWRMAQVEPHASRGYRKEIAEFVVDLPVEAAVGVCLANRQYGHGSDYQYFIPQWESHLFRTGRTYKFSRQND